MKIYYLGPPASFTHLAAQQLSNNLHSSSSIEDVLINVKKSKQPTLAVVPVENSLEGIVIRALDLILQNNLKVIQEINLKIKQNLLSTETNLKNIQTVYSHPHALAQVRGWLKKHLSQAKLKEASSTSKAAEIVKNIPKTAAVASIDAAKRYSLNVLSKNIQDNKMNLTRFWVVAKNKKFKIKNLKLKINTKTSLYIIIKDKVGALRNLLDTFADNHISLTSIQSRPLPNQPWKYGFFCDLLVDANDPLAKKMLAQLNKIHPTVKLLGTYPQLGTFNQKQTYSYNLKRITAIFKQNTRLKPIKLLIKKSAALIIKNKSVSQNFKRVLKARLYLMPSVALYKYQRNKKLTDKQREQEIMQKIKTSKKIITESKNIQELTIKLIRSKTIKPKQIASFTLKELRYYIDYLDTLTQYI